MQSTQSEIAESIARRAHEGRLDKAGAPYIEHSAHVAAAVEDEKAEAIAWLHDVVEDTAYMLSDLETEGINDTVIEADGARVEKYQLRRGKHSGSSSRNRAIHL